MSNMKDKYQPTSTMASLLYAAVFPVVLCYYESIFRISTTGGFWHLSTLVMLLFSVAYGLLVYLPLSFIHNPKANRIVTAVGIGVLALPYVIEYFVYYSFKVFYDLNTVFGGAGDVLTGFSGEIVNVVFNWNGLWMLLLFLLPLLLYLFFGKPLALRRPATGRLRWIAAGTMVLSYSLSLLLVLLNPVYAPIYTKEYSFQSAVSHFGLFTGVGLEVQHLVIGDSGDSFEKPTVTPPQAEPDISEPESSDTEASQPEKPKEYGYNQLPLDFNKPTKEQRIKDLNAYVQTQQASHKNAYTGLFKGKNLIMISAEAFSHKAIDPQLTPTLYRLANKGIRFTDYYQPASAGTTGGEYQNLFGMLPMDGGMSLKNTASHYNATTMGTQLNKLGYFGMAFHNNTYTYYDRHKTHINLGYSNGYMGYGNGMEKYVKNRWPQSDMEMIDGTMPLYIDKQPFNVYYMSVSGHGGYDRDGNAMTSKNWDKVAHLAYSDPVKGYIAANLELEYAMQHLVAKLEEKGIADDTVICMTADHFPYGLDNDGKLGNMPYLSELYGFPVNNYFDRDHNALILWSGCLEKRDPIVVDTPTFSLDILPTLSNLFGVDFDSRLQPGRDVFSAAEPLVFNTNYDWKTAYGTYLASTGKFTPAPGVDGVPKEYVGSMKAIVRNKIRYCQWVLDTDYYRYLFKK